MKNIGLVYNASKKENLDLTKKVEKHLQSKGIKTSTYKAGIENPKWDTLDKKLDVAIILGGDGTLLSASRKLAPKGIPIFGINTGHLGFLTDGTQGEILNLVDLLLRKKYFVDERFMLSCKIINSKKHGPIHALNDVVISRGTNRKMAQLTLTVDNKPVADYIADGLIISTPTGSTAYALSAGGSVMDPTIDGIQIVPICAHSLTSRPHIVSDKREITITVNKPHEGLMLQIDGQETFDLSKEANVKITRAKHSVKLLRLETKENDFYSRIRQKFH